MTPVEFKAWFEGFTEALTGVPNKEQWKRIKARVAEIDGTPVTKEVFRDRYWGPYYHGPWWTTSYTNTVPCGSMTSTLLAQQLSYSRSNQAYASTQAMYALGKADAAQVTG
jgi:hypothetical protein